MRVAHLVHTRLILARWCICVLFFHAEDGIRDSSVTGVQTCALPISCPARAMLGFTLTAATEVLVTQGSRSEEHTSELQSHLNLVCRLLLATKTRRPRPSPPRWPRPARTPSCRAPNRT